MASGTRRSRKPSSTKTLEPPEPVFFIDAELAENFVRTMPQTLRFLRRHQGPWIAKLYRPASGELHHPGRIQMWLTFQAWLKQR